MPWLPATSTISRPPAFEHAARILVQPEAKPLRQRHAILPVRRRGMQSYARRWASRLLVSDMIA